MHTKLTLLLMAVQAAASVATAAENTDWVIDTQEQWTSNLSKQSEIQVTEGIVSPTAQSATLQSKLKSFSEKKSASSIVFEQSPKWLNWEPAGNIGTPAMEDAPVVLSLGPNNYWMFGLYKGAYATRKNPVARKNTTPANFVPKKATLEGFDIPLLTTIYPNEFTAPGGVKESAGGYHAWQSRDMKNWVHHGPITEGVSRWVTTAEYVDGKAYFYYDFPNDQDPHVYIDEDMTDGVLGKDMGMVFKDPSHGSDCVFIRDLDGDFHVVYEDWSPINARKHAWDSPLAGHAVSKDGLSDFKILAPAVDERTNPTGKMDTFEHIFWHRDDPANYKNGIAEYEIHEPKQDAFGDWASISIGGQYYLFGDYDPASHGQMSVAWFTSSSIDEQFEFCGNIGKGHPDPDVCFAEGRFYLVTQQKQDFVSSGPWVETVDVRVGVDTDNDKKIDQWSDWNTVKEAYDYTPGFAKQIQKTAAAMDLSTLPAGYGFQFEVKITDTTKNESKPEIDKIEILFN